MVSETIEREYVIPLRKKCIKKPRYERTRIAIRTIRRFIMRHMKIRDKDPRKVKIDIHFNNEIWFRGRKNPPAKIKVKAIKNEGIVKVTFAEIPEYVKYKKAKIERRHRAVEKKKESKEKKENLEEKIEEKKEEKEKEISIAEQRTKEAKKFIKEKKHITKIKTPQIHRKALKK